VGSGDVMRGIRRNVKALVVTDAGVVAGIITSSDRLEIISRTGHKERPVLRDRSPRRHRNGQALLNDRRHLGV
jgi:hypothetical protein